MTTPIPTSPKRPAALLRTDEAASKSSTTSTDMQKCQGCTALTERLEKLERQVAALEQAVHFAESTVLGTTSCYWLTIAIHCVLLGLTAVGVEILGILFYPLIMGSIGSLMVSHVLANRAVIQKFARTLLSVACVGTVATTALSQATGVNSVWEIVQFLLVFIPPVFISAWLTGTVIAKTCDWMIVPVGNDGSRPRMKLSDFFFVTFVVAVYFSLFRGFVNPSSIDLSDADSWVILSFAGVASILNTIAAAMVARGVLVTKVSIKWIVSACLLFALGLIGIFGGFLFLSGEFEISDALSYFGYTVICAILGVTSPLITFSLMRTARYRFFHRALLN
ncbi:MAG: hypothetical protein R3C53_07725 [Pirellulaceae bacterium]